MSTNEVSIKFEKENVDFGEAVRALKAGKRVCRKGWNGKDQYLELGKDISYTNLKGDNVVAYHEDIGSQAIVFCGTRGRQMGWLASQSDMLAEDWCILED